MALESLGKPGIPKTLQNNCFFFNVFDFTIKPVLDCAGPVLSKALNGQMIEIFKTKPEKARQPHPPDSNNDKGFAKTRHPGQDQNVPG